MDQIQPRMDNDKHDEQKENQHGIMKACAGVGRTKLWMIHVLYIING
jgi:hypothetical protein